MEDVAGAERIAARQVLGRGEDGDRPHRRPEGGEGADPVQRPGAAGHVALHVLHPGGGLDRDAARVERDRLADDAEHQVALRTGRVVAQDDQARLVPAASAYGAQRAHPQLVELARREHFGGQVLVLGRELLRLLAERVRVELVRRHVREVARAVGPLGDDRRPLHCSAQLRVVGVADHDPLGRPGLVLRLPAARRVGAEDRPLDERRRLLGQRHRERLVEQPDERSAHPRESLGRRGARRPQRVGVDLVPLPDARRDQARRLELAVEVEEDRLATLAAQLAALGESREPSAELAVKDLRTVAAKRLCHQQRQGIRARLPGEGDLDLGHRSAMVTLPDVLRCIDSPEIPRRSDGCQALCGSSSRRFPPKPTCRRRPE